ncbi:PREDICTED: 3-oxoacyl-[acyl-carrier-protein] reductase FabG-like, partial [Priapulus caudatus]|uniref:3-oxoacyl-[acyl-carrier-protein] reductase n=1 Tax=Priapulus caudatus TaxID=37621 RepID=A0ABM1F7V6_PRICU
MLNVADDDSIASVMKTISNDFGAIAILVNNAGFIDTDMTKALSEEQCNAMLAGIPLGRLGEPEDIANTVLFL